MWKAAIWFSLGGRGDVPKREARAAKCRSFITCRYHIKKTEDDRKGKAVGDTPPKLSYHSMV